MKKLMRIAVEGCCHGELDKIYETIKYLQELKKITVDLLLICGDFQAVRNEADLNCMSVPDKYKEMQTFYKYYSGEVTAPIPTIFIGGNHEASNYLQELFYGGYVAPNIYYLGASGVVNFNGMRIGGLSGIYMEHNYHKGHHERPPYPRNQLKSIYHTREEEVYKVQCIKQPLDVFLSHDWPTDIAFHGDLDKLLKKKQFFKTEIHNHSLGSPPNRLLLNQLKPKYWFSAHLHVKFPAVVKHDCQATSCDENEIDIDLDMEETDTISPPKAGETKFLSLDKCLPGRDFLQIVEFEVAEGTDMCNKIKYDKEWLSILHATHHLTSASLEITPHPDISSLKIEESRKLVDAKFRDDLVIPDSHIKHDDVEIYDPSQKSRKRKIKPTATQQGNLQTDNFLRKLGLEHCLGVTIPYVASSGAETSSTSTSTVSAAAAVAAVTATNPDEIDIDDI